MALELALRNLACWSLQVGVLVLSAAALARLLPIERPAARLAFWQALLALLLGLPILQPWRAATSTVSGWQIGPTAALPAESAGGGVAFHAAPVWPLVVAGLLLSGLGLRLLQLAAGFVRLRSLSRNARPLALPPWLRALRDDVAPRSAFVLTREECTPATFGLRRPIVLLPSSFLSFDRERQQAVALHELVHVRRADWLSLLLEEALKAVLFFHPAVHWLVARIRLAREQCVDAEVVRRLGGRQAYLESLVEVARFAARSRAVPAAPLLRESHLRERVDLLLKGVSMSRIRTFAHAALSAAAVLLTVAWAAYAAPLRAAKPAAHGATVAVSDKVSAPGEPKLVHKVDPAYPPDARAEKVEGTFRIDVLVGEDGAIKEARVVSSAPTKERLEALEPKKGTPAALEGDARLAKAALDAVKGWRYQPLLKNARPVEFKATITVRFALA